MEGVQTYPYNTVSQLDRATAFALDVVNGKTISGETEIQSCQRHINDLKRQNTPGFPYYWDPDEAQVLIDFAESLTIAEGEEPEPLMLKGFQDFIFGSWHGWKKLSGHRRFRTSYIQVARQNGKSLGNAVPSLYYGNFDGYNYPQVYCTATKEDQAKIVLRECIKFIDSEEELSGTEYVEGYFTTQEYKSTILCNKSKGFIRALGRDTKTIDGFRPYFASVDEYHLHQTNQMYKLLSDGTKKLLQCLISVITTAGFDLNSPCFQLYEYCKNVLLGLEGYEDETQFIYICELDEKDDIWDEKNWPKANPLWTQQTLESLRTDAVKAKGMQGEELKNFMTKSLNRWVQFANGRYMNMAFWKKCKSSLTLENMRGKDCYLGIDLSSGGDLTTGALEILYEVDDLQKFHIHSHSFIPKSRVAEHVKTDKAPYDMWIEEKLLTPTETLSGVKTDYKYIISYYKELIAKYDLKLQGIAYDPHNADAFLSDLEEFGVDCVEIIQSAKSLNDATEDFRLEVEAGNVTYSEGSKLLTWSMANAKTTSNSFGEIKVDKESLTKRIDPVDAVIDAHKLGMSRPKKKVSVYEERGMRKL